MLVGSGMQCFIAVSTYASLTQTKIPKSPCSTLGFGAIRQIWNAQLIRSLVFEISCKLRRGGCYEHDGFGWLRTIWVIPDRCRIIIRITSDMKGVCVYSKAASSCTCY